jgi:hypothetical protein
MNKKSKLLLIFIVVVVLLSVAVTFYKTIVLHDFKIVNVTEE